MKLELTNLQKDFIQIAINLKEAIIDFDMTDKEFKNLFGVNKKTMIKEIENLENKI